MVATQTDAAAPPLIRQNPFPGLRPFEESEACLYFGREQEIVALLGRMMRQHFLAVLGSSGCGKSSLIKAGLIPSLKYEQLDDGDPAWRIALTRPGDDPFKQLALALTREEALGKGRARAEADVPVMQMILRRGPLGLVEAVREAALPPEAKVLVLVDQFEELFRFPVRAEKARALDEARAFCNLLLAAAEQRDFPVYIVLTMRSEFLGQCAAFRGLAEAITDGLYLLPDMTRDQLREVIQRPIALHGGAIFERLVNRLLNDLGGNTDQLPILQHALMRLWANWEPHDADGPMDLTQYEVIGELKGSLSAHAQSIYEGDLRTPREKELAEALFRSITETTPEGQTVRRPTKLGAVCRRAGATVEELKPVIEQFRAEGRSFLIPPLGVELDGETTVDISHESLIRQWKRLSDWAEAEAKETKLYADLRHDAASWDEREHPTDWLYTGVRLVEAQRWAEAHPNLLDDARAKKFLTAGGEIQKYSGLLARARKWEAEGRDESFLLRGRELREAEGWLKLADTSEELRPLLLRPEVKELVSYSGKSDRALRVMKLGLLVMVVGLLVITGWAVLERARANSQAERADSQAKEADLKTREAEQARSNVLELLADSEKKKTEITNQLVTIDKLRELLGSGKAAKVEELDEILQSRRSIPINYYFRAEDGKTIVGELQNRGFTVTISKSNEPTQTNAIWWGEGIKLKDLQLLASTLIKKGIHIRYIGKSVNNPGLRQIQIGTDNQSVELPEWTEKKVRSLKKLPEDNEQYF
jgi:energy-coupling factor transporter ATP-binding protein EcfA2